jgi:predicted ester cyclase
MQSKAIIDANVATVRRFFDGTHAGDVDVIDETVDEAIVTHGFPGGSPQSRQQYKDWFRGFGASFSNMAFETPTIVADESHVVVRWRVSVDHTGPFAGVPATGRRVTFGGVAIYRMANGRIAETWLHADEMAMLSQIGAMPAPARAA